MVVTRHFTVHSDMTSILGHLRTVSGSVLVFQTILAYVENRKEKVPKPMSIQRVCNSFIRLALP